MFMLLICTTEKDIKMSNPESKPDKWSLTDSPLRRPGLWHQM